MSSDQCGLQVNFGKISLLESCMQAVSLLQLKQHLQQPHIGMLALGLFGDLDVDLYISLNQSKQFTCCFCSSVCCL